jgi:two-component system sensor histidine kinase KdpD
MRARSIFRTRRKRAIENYFSPGNLTALRELALRRTAQRVDEQLLTTCRRTPFPDPGRPATGCSSASTSSRAAPRSYPLCARQADRLRAPWAALHIETTALGHDAGGGQGPARGDLRLAEQLGGEAITMPGQNVARRHRPPCDGLNNFTHIVVGKPTKSRWREWSKGRSPMT